ncbi:hypothetical protein SLS62_002179 [Diatrype stigma]|uniref:Uncharacterized protein n=1 Tax=Diatrype stigma TaxID=117547 RepID=A0AAN9UYX4_9PEZI
MSPFTPTRRQVSPPFVDSSPSPRSGSRSGSRLGSGTGSGSGSGSPRPSQDSFALGSRIALIQRLTDLAMKINQENREEDGSLDKLHAMMDQMEFSISNHDRNRDANLGKSEPSGSSPEANGGNVAQDSHVPEKPMDDRSNSVPPVEPSSSGKESHVSKSDAETQTGRATKTSEVDAERIVAEAQTLCKGLEEVVANLKARQEESDARAERAAQHIMYLEKRVQELENERNENEMEILNLQFQLKAIEVQCLSYVPKDADQDLRESISAWKTEWSALKRKRARKKDCVDSASGSPRNHASMVGSPGTPSRRPPAHKSSSYVDD